MQHQDTRFPSVDGDSPFSLDERFYAEEIQLAFRNKDIPWEID